jgi:hypothetical protein
MAIITDIYSDHDMQCPASWYGGFKQGRVIRFGDGERELSDIWAGDWRGSTFSLSLSDFDARFRQQLASERDRYWSEPLTIRMTTRANRAVLGTPYVVFVGPIIDVRFTQKPRSIDLTLGDIVSQGMIADQYQVPWRLVRDGVLDELDVISETLDRDQPEPIIYGEHRRIPDSDPASPQGFQITPIYLGQKDGDYWWLVAGHACADLPDVLVWTPDEEGALVSSVSKLADGDWAIPHTSASAFEDIRSATFGNDRRYTLIKALIGNADADACVAGTKVLTVFVDGVEPNGDGTGTVITDRIQQYKHFLINFVANRGPVSYQAGAWLTNPEWTVSGGNVPIVEEDTFDACTAIGEERLPLPSGSPSPAPDYAAGYVGAAVIGASASDRSSVRRWIADWNRSCGLRFGINHLGQMRVAMLHPTEDGKAAAPLYTAAYEILAESFDPSYLWAEKVNRIPWRADYEHTSGQWKTAGVVSDDDAITKYGVEILSETREYPFAPGITMANHLAVLESRVRRHPLRLIRFDATVGHDYLGQSLGYLDLGDYIRYQHFSAIANSPTEIRLAQIVKHQVQAGRRRVMVEAIDCDDLIGYDEPEEAIQLSGDLNDTCDSAITITPALTVNYTIEIDTTEHAEDTTVAGLCGSPEGAFHAAWWDYTPPQDQTGHVTTGLSDYDTVLSVWTGGCGSLSLEECNDNDGLFQTSFIEFTDANPLLSGVTYRFLVSGFNPEDTGRLVFTLFLEPL